MRVRFCLDPVITSRPKLRVADAVALARNAGGYFSGAIAVGSNDALQVDADLELGVLRVAVRVAGDVFFAETDLIAERMPRGGARQKARCMACERPTFAVFVSEDRRHLVCSDCAGAKYASRALSTERRSAFIASKLLARSGGGHLGILHDDAPGYLPLRDRARFARHVSRFARRHRERLARATRRASRMAGSFASETADLAELHRVLVRLIDALVQREVESGRRDPGIALAMEFAADVLATSAELQWRTETPYWAAAIERACRKRPAASPPLPRLLPDAQASRATPPPGAPPNAASMALEVMRPARAPAAERAAMGGARRAER